MTLITDLANSLNAADSQEELAAFIADHLTKDDDGITIDYQNPDGNGYDRALIRLEKDRLAIAYGSDTLSTRVVLTASNAFFVMPNNEQISLSDLIIAVKMLLRRTVD